MATKKELARQIKSLDKYNTTLLEQIDAVEVRLWNLLDYLGLDIEDAGERIVKVKKGKK